MAGPVPALHRVEYAGRNHRRTAAAGSNRFTALAGKGKLQRLSEVEAREESRVPTGIAEFDRVLGGGLVPGAVVLIGGDPGIGKSTLLLQALARDRRHAQGAVRERRRIAAADRAARAAARRSMRRALQHAGRDPARKNPARAMQTEQPEVAVIDSIQTLYSDALHVGAGLGGAGARMRGAADALAKQPAPRVILVGHVTKEGALAGPRVLEHMVDTVLYFEGDTHSSFRLMRAFKNRFGAVNELGVFAMTEQGPEGRVQSVGAVPVAARRSRSPGSCVHGHAGRHAAAAGRDPGAGRCLARAAIRAGSRVGLEQNRLALLLAVLHRHAGIACLRPGCVRQCGRRRAHHRAGGRPGGAAGDRLLAARTGRCRPKLVVFGEVGLAGEIRPVQRGQERLREAAKLGFTHALIPKANAPKQAIAGLTVIAVRRVAEAVAHLRDGFAT